MALAALIIAMRAAGTIVAVEPRGADRLVATLPLLGRTLVEHQARQARAAGAVHIVLLVERMPAALIAALDRLRRDGIPIEVARAAADASDRFHPDEAVLLIGDGVVAPQPLVARLGAAAPPALATFAESAGGAPERAGFERIDGTARWAGLALADGDSVRRMLAGLGDWDAESTLVRRTVQAGAMRIDAGPPDARPVRIEHEAALPALEARLARGSGTAGGNAGAATPGWAGRWLLAPVAGIAARLLAPRGIEADWLAFGGSAAAVAGGGLALAGRGWAGLALFLASGPLALTARRLAELRLARVRREAAIEAVRATGGALMAVGLALGMGGWGWLLVAATAVLAMLALARERGMLARAGGTAPAWLADPDGLGWLLLAVAIGGGWAAGLGAIAGYAALSFAVAQHRLERRMSV